MHKHDPVSTRRLSDINIVVTTSCAYWEVSIKLTQPFTWRVNFLYFHYSLFISEYREESLSLVPDKNIFLIDKLFFK